jgi:hypothetical protein
MSRIVLAIALAVITGCVSAQGAAQHSNAPLDSPIGYATVAEALADLRARPGLSVITQGGWTIIEDNANYTLWSFTEAGHPAHPAAIKRYSYEHDGQVLLGMKALCQAPKAPCDELIEQFRELNEKAREHAQERLK